MTEEERQRVLAGLVVSEGRVLALVAGLSAKQWAFREMPDSEQRRWSIAEIVEHLAVFERFILNVVCEAVAQPCDGQRKEAAAEFFERNEGLVLGLAGSRSTKFKAREVTSPVGRWAEPERIVAEFREARARSIDWVKETQVDLRDYFFAHVALGDMDCYQWLLLLGTHTERHVLQIEEVIADEGFPR
jgi:hypothetical protein